MPTPEEFLEIKKKSFQEIQNRIDSYDAIYFLLIDVAHFSPVLNDKGLNDAWTILQEIKELLDHQKDLDFVCSLGGDDFAAILKKTKELNEEYWVDLLSNIHSEMSHQTITSPFRLRIGICESPKDGRTTKEILRAATIALKEAKDQNRGISIY